MPVPVRIKYEIKREVGGILRPSHEIPDRRETHNRVPLDSELIRLGGEVNKGVIRFNTYQAFIEAARRALVHREDGPTLTVIVGE